MTLIELTATEAIHKIRAGEITSEELVQACLDRIDQVNGEIEAWAHQEPEHALDQARRLDAHRAKGEPMGPLHGVPVGVKDIIDTADFPTENGTVMHAGRTPSNDATLVARLRQAGAVILGKTVTTELAVYAPGKTKNPHDPTRTPGGSSSGSAAAVASYMAPLAVGTQTNGSVIRPASFCGVYAFKPTIGLISRHGVLKQSRPFDTVGVFGRTLEDLALIAENLMGYDDHDAGMQPKAQPRISSVMADEPPVEPRFAFVRTPVWDQAEESTKDAFREVIDHANGRIDIVDLGPPFDSAHEDHRQIMEADLALSFAKEYTDGKDKLSTVLRDMIERGQTVRAMDYNAALERIADYNAELAEIFDAFDAILTPSAAGEAPVGLDSTGSPAFCTIWTLCGVPALNLPIMEGPNGMPLGVQLVSFKGDDARLFRTARWLLNFLEIE
jgi:Asp-tRNA(Asn)/Glu-tRNA(Gln) amidotransferase A subunit family amidase